MANMDGFEKVGEYAWAKKGRKYWNLWIGNPFCISRFRLPASLTKEAVISEVAISQRRERKRFKKSFPTIKWGD